MFTIIGIMLLGIFTGYTIGKRQKIPFIHNIITFLIWLLLFILGVEAGSNDKIIEGISSLGTEAIILSLSAVIGSCFAAWILWIILYKNKGKKA